MIGDPYPAKCPHGYLVVQVKDVSGWTHRLAPSECPVCPPGDILSSFKPGGVKVVLPDAPAPDYSPCTKTEGCVLIGPHEGPTPCLTILDVDEDGKPLLKQTQPGA